MLSNNLKRFRKQKGLTQENVAEALNVVRQTISKWEKGNISSGCRHVNKIGRSIRCVCERTNRIRCCR